MNHRPAGSGRETFIPKTSVHCIQLLYSCGSVSRRQVLYKPIAGHNVNAREIVHITFSVGFRTCTRNLVRFHLHTSNSHLLDHPWSQQFIPLPYLYPVPALDTKCRTWVSAKPQYLNSQISLDFSKFTLSRFPLKRHGTVNQTDNPEGPRGGVKQLHVRTTGKAGLKRDLGFGKTPQLYVQGMHQLLVDSAWRGSSERGGTKGDRFRNNFVLTT